ncbi:MAG: IS1634 family transposase [Prevotella sp.]|nr:IS1634 family transposase [Prevotella sp.]
MNFTSQIRYNPETGENEKYYRLKESYRNASGHACTRILLNVGFIHGLKPEEIRDISRGLTYKYEHQGERELWEDQMCTYSDVVRGKIDEYWTRMVEEKSLDIIPQAIEASKAKAERRISVDTLEHTDARDIGAEWLCLQAIRQIKFDKFLRSLGWGEEQVKIAVGHLILRTIYTPSELKSMRIMRDNSGICELLDLAFEAVSQRKVYSVADWFLREKVKIEKYLCQTTDDLFRPTNRVMLFDLTNFYFEGRKDGSKKARHGRSKEKRNDCKLLVLALAINTDGFIRYSAILEGNTADPKSLPDMVDKLIATNPVGTDPDQKVLVVIDAGIASQENLDLIREKGYNYLCVSRKALTDYEVKPGARIVTVRDCRERPIKLQEVHVEGDDYYLKIDSPAKALKEASMNRSFRRRFEEGLDTIAASLTKKGGTKKYEAVIKRIGKLEGRYPSIARYYHINVEKGEKGRAASVTWTLEVPEKHVFGTYFLRTNVKTLDEKTTWDYYNLIREIECSNRQLKTDLNLRPIYHRKDDRSDAHLFLGLLSYWIVNVIRHQMKKVNEARKAADPDPKAEYPTPYWTEIVRMMSTQKAVTSEAVNALGEKVEMRICSTPTEQAAEIYSMLKYKQMPFRKIKICRTQQT